ncbi:hypothetical protein [Bradyrhizobium japonicum]|uniref:hypothetical protein n=1 Tax=Bradyrhizobium japonicum TaxID=375 RepID=UPI001E48924C|nr:hypothetical protein [Bradyrhizobium japonicum]MCD9817667.1 hypothetical protein [Bradyrhizobium japonicum]MEB2672490.1 hypothetical protein [Bradyrhizobium japonicum]WRI91751.1 hypothetical protein R3F75_12820 [Bradyrhizobium japonicum]
MKYSQPYGVTDTNAPYINGDPSTGTAGSIPPAASIEYPQREIVNFIADNGLAAPDNGDLRQLSKGIQSGLVNFGVDTGVVNQMSVNLTPALTSYYRGLRIYVLAAVSNTGATVLSVNGLTFKPVKRRDGTDLKANDITAGSIQLYIYDGTVFQLFGAGMSGGAGLLTQNLDIYVNYSIGNDTNDGTANDAAHALKNIQRAINLAFIYPPSQYTITIHVADSPSYAGFYTPYWSGPNIKVTGNVANPQNVLVTGQNTHAVQVAGVNTLTCEGITVATTLNAAGPGGGFVSSNGASLFTNNTRSNYVTGAVFEAYQANVNIGVHSFNGNCGEMYWSYLNGLISWNDGVAQNIVAPITVGYCAYATQGGAISVPPSRLVWTGFGNVTGQKYYAYMNGTIGTSGGGVNFFPGTVAGATANGGQYV